MLLWQAEGFFQLQTSWLLSKPVARVLGWSLHQLRVWFVDVQLIPCGSERGPALPSSSHHTSMCRSKCYLVSGEPLAATKYLPPFVPVRTYASAPRRNRGAEIAARISASPSLFSPHSEQTVFLLPRKTLTLYHAAEERRRPASAKLWEIDCNAVSACSFSCPPVSGLVWGRSAGSSCFQSAPHGHLSYWFTEQREETPEATWL